MGHFLRLKAYYFPIKIGFNFSSSEGCFSAVYYYIQLAKESVIQSLLSKGWLKCQGSLEVVQCFFSLTNSSELQMDFL